MSRGTVQQMPFSPVETVRVHSVRPQVDEVKYPAKPVMRDDAGVVPCKFLAWQRETAPQAASRPEGWLPAAKIKIADNKNKKARASPWGQGTRLCYA